MSAQRKSRSKATNHCAAASKQYRIRKKVIMTKIVLLPPESKSFLSAPHHQNHTSACEPKERAVRTFVKCYGLNMPRARLAVDLCGIGGGGNHA